MKKNLTEVFGEGYNAGYNQCRVDRKEITQKEADKLLIKGRKIRREK